MLFWSILVAIVLYILEGLIQGLTSSIPIFLSSHKASWEQQGTFSWVYYPFSLKVLWAPIIDSIYIRRFGRHQTWLVPIQFMIGCILLILSFYLEYLMTNLQAVQLTIVFFLIYFLIATQDIVVDGWCIILFASSNVQWASTCQSIGQTIGMFLGSTVLLMFESSNFTNKYVRKLLSLPQNSQGLFTVEQFTLFWSFTFIFVGIILLIIFMIQNCCKKNNAFDSKYKEDEQVELRGTYRGVLELFKKRCICEFTLILFTFNFGFAATLYMTNITLIGYGIPRDTLALLNFPLPFVNIFISLVLSRTQRPLMWFAGAYIPRLILCILLALYVFFTPRLLNTIYFYPILIILLCLNEGFNCLLFISRIGFCSKISEPRIAGTYMTFLSTISNLGKSFSSTSVLYIAHWLPKSENYSIEVGVCFILGLVWIVITWPIMRRLDRLPDEEWHLKPSLSVSDSQSNFSEIWLDSDKSDTDSLCNANVVLLNDEQCEEANPLLSC